jgi:hypothetical protein
MKNILYYNNPKNYSVNEVLNATYVGLTFEFFSTKDSQFIIEDLQNISGKQVILTDENYEPTWSTAILLKEYSGPRSLYKFSIGLQNYQTIGTILNDTLKWINSSAYVNESTGLKIKLNFDNKQLQTINTISNMNLGKLILKLDETYIHQRFPEASKSPYALTMKKLVPLNNFALSEPMIHHINEDFEIPKESYYGIDLTEQRYGNLIFNYSIGAKYPEKIKEINELLFCYILTAFNSINEKEYTEAENKEFEKLTEDYRKLRRCYYDPKYFLNEYKDIKISVDLISNQQTIISFWDKIRDNLLKLMVESNFRKGYINLDTEDERYQLKNADLYGVKIKNVDIARSDLNGCVFENAYLYHAKVTGSQLFGGIIVNSCEISESKLSNVRIDRANKIHKCYILNMGEVVNCNITESIVRNATMGKETKLDEHSIVIERKNITNPAPVMGIDVKEVRDYRWIKQLSNPDKGEQKDIIHTFANQYKNKW